jgi:FtsH-binding integral membrane protein
MNEQKNIDSMKRAHKISMGSTCFCAAGALFDAAFAIQDPNAVTIITTAICTISFGISSYLTYKTEKDYKNLKNININQH